MTTDQSPNDAERTPGIEWHPDALRPPFNWRVQLPTDWAVLETHPARWKRQNERIVDDYFAGRRVPSKVRRELLRTLEDAVTLSQKNKILLTLLKPGIDAEGRIENIALSLAFSSTAPRLASMAPIERAFGSQDSYTERTTPTGNAYATVAIRKRQRDGDGYREVLSAQAFYPLPATTWTLVVAVTTPRVDLSEQLIDLAIRCVSSVRVDDVEAVAEEFDTVESFDSPPVFDDAIELVTFSVRQ